MALVLVVLLVLHLHTASPAGGPSLPALRAKAVELQALAVAEGALTPGAAAPSSAARATRAQANEAWRAVIDAGERSGDRKQVHAARQRLGINLSIEGVSTYHDESTDMELVGNLLGEGLAMVEWSLAEAGPAPGSAAEQFHCLMYTVVNRYTLLQASVDQSRSTEAAELTQVAAACTRCRERVDPQFASVSSLRQLYTICCEAPRRLGVLKPRDKGVASFSPTECTSEAAAHGLWPSASQRPAALVGEAKQLPGPEDGAELRTAPVWQPADLGPDGEAMLAGLQEAWEAIRDEAVGLTTGGKRSTAWELEGERLHEAGRWTQLQLWRFGKRIEEGCAQAPVTCGLIERLDSGRLVTGHSVGLVEYSRLAPGTVIKPHTGPDNSRIRAHLGLITPEGAGLRVAEHTLGWSEGQIIVFDDSFEHEVWHRGAQNGTFCPRFT
jgi:hypothetical protein|eukprot:COSAG06_NODE_3450_length_5328_cov_2.564735_3_plen_440_part_00